MGFYSHGGMDLIPLCVGFNASGDFFFSLSRALGSMFGLLSLSHLYFVLSGYGRRGEHYGLLSGLRSWQDSEQLVWTTQHSWVLAGQ